MKVFYAVCLFLSGGCAHTKCRTPEEILSKRGVVLECSSGPVIDGEPTQSCLVAQPSGTAVTVNLRVGNCSP